MSKPEKVAVVTGGAQGIGKASALRLCRSGFAIVIVDLQSASAENAAAEIREEGGNAIAIQADVTDFARAHSATQQIRDTFGRVDVLLNNAGRTMPKGLLEITEEEWHSTIDSNLKGAFCWCRATVPMMLEQGSGRIINIASIAGLTGGVTSAVSKFAYAAAKAGVMGLTRGLAKEFGKTITVNSICPGIIQTELTRGLIAAKSDYLRSGIAMDRLGEPEDVASVVHFLATSEPNYVTGQHFLVDGGQWML
jgi:3-oxoacyl-[acyl-carrier protein] reductase